MNLSRYRNFVCVTRELPEDIVIDGQTVAEYVVVSNQSYRVLAKSEADYLQTLAFLVARLRFSDMKDIFRAIIYKLCQRVLPNCPHVLAHLIERLGVLCETGNAGSNIPAVCILQHRINLAIVATPDRLFAVVPQDRCARVLCYDITFDRAKDIYDHVSTCDKSIYAFCDGFSPVAVLFRRTPPPSAICLDKDTYAIGNAVFEGGRIVNASDFPVFFEWRA